MSKTDRILITNLFNSKELRQSKLKAAPHQSAPYMRKFLILLLLTFMSGQARAVSDGTYQNLEVPNSSSATSTTVAYLTNGEVVICWINSSVGYCQIMTAGGVAGPAITMDANTPYTLQVMALGSTNTFVVVYDSKNSGIYEIYGVIYNSEGTMTVPDWTISSQSISSRNQSPMVASFASGNFAVAWAHFSSGITVYSAVFSSSGTRVTPTDVDMGFTGLGWNNLQSNSICAHPTLSYYAVCACGVFQGDGHCVISYYDGSSNIEPNFPVTTLGAANEETYCDIGCSSSTIYAVNYGTKDGGILHAVPISTGTKSSYSYGPLVGSLPKVYVDSNSEIWFCTTDSTVLAGSETPNCEIIKDTGSALTKVSGGPPLYPSAGFGNSEEWGLAPTSAGSMFVASYSSTTSIQYRQYSAAGDICWTLNGECLQPFANGSCSGSYVINTTTNTCGCVTNSECTSTSPICTTSHVCTNKCVSNAECIAASSSLSCIAGQCAVLPHMGCLYDTDCNGEGFYCNKEDFTCNNICNNSEICPQGFLCNGPPSTVFLTPPSIATCQANGEKISAAAVQTVGGVTTAMMAAAGGLMIVSSNPSAGFAIVSVFQQFFYLTFLNVEYPLNIMSFLNIFEKGILSFFPNLTKPPATPKYALPSPPHLYSHQHTGYFFQTGGSGFSVVIVLLAVWAVTRIVHTIIKPEHKIRPKIDKVLAIFEWGLLTRVWLMYAMPLAFGSILQLYAVQTGIVPVGFATLFACIIIPFSFIFIYFGYKIIKANYRRDQFPFLYEEFRDVEGIVKYSALIYYARRVIEPLIIVICYYIPGLQLTLLAVISLTFVIYVFTFKPRKELRQNYFEVLSDSMLTICYCLFFQFLTPGQTPSIKVGTAGILLLTIVLGVQFLMSIANVFIQAIEKKKAKKEKALKEQEEKERKLKETEESPEEAIISEQDIGQIQEKKLKEKEENAEEAINLKPNEPYIFSERQDEDANLHEHNQKNSNEEKREEQLEESYKLSHETEGRDIKDDQIKIEIHDIESLKQTENSLFE